MAGSPARKVSTGAARRKGKYPRQAARTEKNKATQAKARKRWLTKRIDKLSDDPRTRGRSYAINMLMMANAAGASMTITEYKKSNPNWRKEIASTYSF